MFYGFKKYHKLCFIMFIPVHRPYVYSKTFISSIVILCMIYQVFKGQLDIQYHMSLQKMPTYVC